MARAIYIDVLKLFMFHFGGIVEKRYLQVSFSLSRAQSSGENGEMVSGGDLLSKHFKYLSGSIRNDRNLG